jgi:hypothetical protein
LTIFPGDFGIRRYLGLCASDLGFESGFGVSIFSILKKVFGGIFVISAGISLFFEVSAGILNIS